MTWLSSSSCFISDTHSAMAADVFPVPSDVRPKCTKRIRSLSWSSACPPQNVATISFGSASRRARTSHFAASSSLLARSSPVNSCSIDTGNSFDALSRSCFCAHCWSSLTSSLFSYLSSRRNSGPERRSRAFSGLTATARLQNSANSLNVNGQS